MTATDISPLFSVIIPTRNRAALFAVALQSVLDQRFPAVEVIVVHDGSAPAHLAEYQTLLDSAPPHVRWLSLMPTERGHGQSYALNFGVAHAQGAYVCFLDDDDQWIDPDHLGRVAGVISVEQKPVDLILANQRAFQDGKAVDRVIWIEDLQPRIGRAPGPTGVYSVTVSDLLACQAHCHLNTTIVRRSFYLEIGGMDEGLRWECDRDFYLRAIDRTDVIRFLPQVVSRHNIPDPTARSSMTTSESELSRRLYQLRVFDKAVLFSVRPELRHYAMHQRTYSLDHIAAAARLAGRTDCALHYRAAALMARVTTAYLGLADGLRARFKAALRER